MVGCLPWRLAYFVTVKPLANSQTFRFRRLWRAAPHRWSWTRRPQSWSWTGASRSSVQGEQAAERAW